MIGVGFTAAPDRDHLVLCEPVFARVDYVEVVPESLVHPQDVAGFRPNGFYDRVRDLQQAHGVDLVAHGTGLSACGLHPLDIPRLERWLERAGHLSEGLDLRWYTDHAGISAPAGMHVTLPIDVPHTVHTQRAARHRLDRLAACTGVPVGIENSVYYTPFADPTEEPAWLRALLGPVHVWVLDLHNLWTHAVNFGLDVDAWLDAAPLDSVIEIHVAGGVHAPAGWTPGEVWRLDSHDEAVPAPVWDLLERVLPRCPALRGVTLERLEGSVDRRGIAALVDEVDRIRDCVRAVKPAASGRGSASDAVLVDCSVDEARRFELDLADAFSSPEPDVALRRLRASAEQPAWVVQALDHALAWPAGIGLTRRLVQRQRFERLVAGSSEANGWFEADPRSFARAFARYAAEVPPTACMPLDEAALFAHWRSSG